MAKWFFRRGAGPCVLLLAITCLSLVPGIGTALAQDDPSLAPPDAELPWIHVRKTDPLDLDGDGASDALKVFGYWQTPVGDTLTIYDDVGNFPQGADWHVADDFVDTTWVFDPGSTGKAALIIRFATEGDHVAAFLWDDQNGDGQVGYQVSGRQLVVTESPFWTTKIWTGAGGWTRPDGGLNYDLHAQFDGCGLCNKLPKGEGYPPAVRARMQIDGVPDFAIDISDDDADGVPEHYVWRMLTDVPVSMYGIPRLLVQSNDGHHVPSPPTGHYFWPLLVPLPEHGNYFDTAPYVPVDWKISQLDVLKFHGYPIEAGYSINSYAYAPTGAAEVYANFENPMAYYDAADDRDGFPELMVRVAYAKANDPVMIYGRSNVPIMDIRYSWNLSDSPSLTWTNKVHLSGRYDITERTRVGNFDVLTVPYADIPHWVMDRQWDATTFVTNERGDSYQSSEGIYEFASSNPTYFAGLDDDPSLGTSPTIESGLRGDWTLEAGSPELYFDPVEHRLHLVGAQGGVWNVDGEREVRYLNTTGGDTIDGWQVRDNGLLVAELYRVPGGLLYSDQAQTLFRPVDIGAPPVRSLPPTDHATWQQLRDELAQTPPAFAPGDLRAMFDQFGGTPIQIADAPLQDFHLTRESVRFVVDASSEVTRNALATLTGVSSSGGHQVVTFAKGQWTATSATFANPSSTITVSGPQGLVGTSIQVNVENPGSIDLTNAYLLVRTVPPPGSSHVETAVGSVSELDITGGSAASFDVPWIPPEGGQWQIKATIYRHGTGPDQAAGGGADVVLAESIVPAAVAAPPHVSHAGVLDAGWNGTTLTRLLVIASLLAVAAGGLAMVLRPRRVAA